MAQVAGTIKAVTGLVGIMKPGGPLYGAKVGDRVEENDIVRTLDPDSTLVLELDGGREIVLGGNEEVLVDQSVFAAVDEGESVDYDTLQAALMEGLDPSDMEETAAGEETLGDSVAEGIYAERGDARGDVSADLRGTEHPLDSVEFGTESAYNIPPDAGDDFGVAVEEGSGGEGQYDAPQTASGNLLANDIDDNIPNPPSDLDVVTIVSDDTANATTLDGSGNFVVEGLYGTLVVNGETGEYTYTVNDADPAINALNIGDTLEESFTYTVSDGMLNDSATLSITVNGSNDAPIAVNDGSYLLNVDSQATLTNISEDPTEGAAVKFIVEGNAGETVTFNWQFNAGDYMPFNDFAFVAVDDGALQLLSNVEMVGDYGTSGLQTFSVTFTESGAHTITFGTVDYGDTGFDSALAVTYVDGGNILDVSTLGSVMISGTTASLSNDGASVSAINDFLDTEMTLGDMILAYEENETDAAVPAVGNVLDNDYDVDNAHPELSVISINGEEVPQGDGATTIYGFYGVLVMESDGSYTYTPYGAESGHENAALIDALNVGDTLSESFTYTVSDNENGGAKTDSATLTVTVSGTNDAPVAVADIAQITEDAFYIPPITLDVLANDYDVDSDDLSLVDAHIISGDGLVGIYNNTVKYVPNWAANQSLNEGDLKEVVIEYTITDDMGKEATSTVTVNIIGVNDHPIAICDYANGDENHVFVIDVLANDWDVDSGDNPSNFTLDQISYNGPGTASIVGNQLQFDPGTAFDYLAEGEHATIYIGYRMSDDSGASSNWATAAITLVGSNDLPVSTDDVVTTLEDNMIALGLDDFGSYSDIESTPIAAVKITDFGNAEGTLQWYNGSAWVTVQAGQVISAADIADGDLRFVPDLNENGSPYTTIGFQVGDGLDFSAESYTLTVNVTPVNDAPVSTDDAVTTPEDTPLVLGLDDFGSYSDVENTPIAAVKITDLGNGEGTLQWYNGSTWVAVLAGQLISAADIEGGNLRFVPDADENGSPYTTLEFQVSDGTDLSTESYTLTINVTPVNDAPTAVDDTGSTDAVTYESVWNYDLNAGNDYGYEDKSVTITAINPGPIPEDDPDYDPVDRMGPTMGIDGELDTDSSQMLNPATETTAPEGIRFEFDLPLKVVVVDFGNFGSKDVATWVVYDVDNNMYTGTFTYSGNPNDVYTIDANLLGADVFFDTVEIINTNPNNYSFSIDQLLGSASGSDTFTEASPLYFTEASLLANDFDPDAGDTLNITGLDSDGDMQSTSAFGATVTLDDEGNILYDPSTIDWENPTWDPEDADTFTYTVSDGTATDTATVSVDINYLDSSEPYGGDTLLIDDYLTSGEQIIDFSNISAMADNIAFIDLKEGDEGKTLQNMTPENVRGLLGNSYDVLHIDGEASLDTVELNVNDWTDTDTNVGGYDVYSGSFEGNEVILYIDSDINVDLIY